MYGDQSNNLSAENHDANYYIAFAISESIENPFQIANRILICFYLGRVIACLCFSFGNRPQGSKFFYAAVLVGFTVITVYMTVAALVLVFNGIDTLVKEKNGPLGLGDLFMNLIFGNFMLSLIAMLGLYVFASLILVSTFSLSLILDRSFSFL